MPIADWMARTGRSDESLARELNVTRATVSRIRRNKQKPSADLAGKLFRLAQGQLSLAEILGIEIEERAA